MIQLTLEQKTPRNIEVDLKQREVRITWADAYQSVYSLDYLRKICPCAICNEQRRNQDVTRGIDDLMNDHDNRSVNVLRIFNESRQLGLDPLSAHP